MVGVVVCVVVGMVVVKVGTRSVIHSIEVFDSFAYHNPTLHSLMLCYSAC